MTNKIKIDKDFLNRVLKKVDENTITTNVHVTYFAQVYDRLSVLEKNQTIVKGTDMDIIFQRRLKPQDNNARGKLLESELIRLIKRYGVRKLHINYES